MAVCGSVCVGVWGKRLGLPLMKVGQLALKEGWFWGMYRLGFTWALRAPCTPLWCSGLPDPYPGDVMAIWSL